MAKQKQPSASKRREQMRQQRSSSSRAQQSRDRYQHKRTSSRSSWWLIGGIIAMVVVIVGAFIFISNYEAQQSKVGSDTALKTISSIKPDIFARVDKGSFNGQLAAVKNTPVLKGPTGKPEVFYMGGEYCPYCAAQRWAIISSLSRFGSFSPLSPILSGEGQVPTFSFHQATYHSNYIDFVSRETADNSFPNPGSLEQLSDADQKIVNQYEQPPYVQQQGIPFMSIGNQYISVGPYYSGDILTGKSYQDIATAVTDSNSDISRGIVGAANMLTAAICKATNNQPANVCSANPIPSLEQALPQPAAAAASPTQLAQAWQMPARDVRRRN